MIIENRKPVNRTAKSILQSGVHYEPEIDPQRFHSDVPNLKLKNLEYLKKSKTFHNFTGFRFGNLEVIGLVDNVDFQKKVTTRWLVRCSCGQYEVRTTKCLKKRIASSFPKDWCERCDDLYRLKYTEKARSLGLSVEEYFRKQGNKNE